MNTSVRRTARKPLLSRNWVSAVLSAHSALGLAFSAVIYLICLTGTVVVFVQEVQRWEQPTAPKTAVIDPEAIDRGIAELRKLAPEAAAQSVSVTMPSSSNPHLVFTAGGHEGMGGESWFANASGQAVMKVRHDLADFFVRLHIDLYLPFGIGAVVVALAGMALLALVISGILTHSRIIKDAFRFRSGGSARLGQADIHNRIGTWGLPFHFVIAFTGAFFGVFVIVFGSVAATTYKGDMFKAFTDIAGPFARSEAHAVRTYPIPRIAPLVAAAATVAPDLTLESVDVQQPGTKGQLIGIGLRAPHGLFLDERIVYDSRGRLVFESDTVGRSFFQQMIYAVRPLHFGWFGGVFVKLAYGLLGLSMCVMTASGFRIWLIRRRDRGRPAPVMERLWTATIWGQPLALALAAILSLVMDAKAAPLLGWGAGTVTAYALACVPSMQARLGVGLRAVTAAALAGLALVHAGISAASHISVVDPVSWAVDAALFVIAFAVARPMLKLRRFPHETLGQPASL